MMPYQVRLVIERRKDADATEREPGDATADDNESPSNTKPTPSPLTFEARWVESDGQSSKTFTLEPPLERQDADDLRWYLEKYHEFVGAGTQARAFQVEAKLEQWGQALFDAVFGTVEGTNVHRNILRAMEDRQPVQLTLGTTEPQVLVQPWELMRDHKGPLAFRGVSIRRQLEEIRPLERLELRLPIRLLLIVSRPTNSGFIDPRTSVRPLLDGLDRLPRGSVEVEFCQPPTLAELEERITAARDVGRPFHIVHFDGHGVYLPRAGVGALSFEKDNRKTDPITGRQLGDLLSMLEVPLVVLEACQTADLSDQPVFGSVAPALLASGVGSVVAFSHAVHIGAASILVERFYRELAEGKSVGASLGSARSRLRAKNERWLALGPNPPTVKLQDWFVPQLYQVGPDLALVGEVGDLVQDRDTSAAPMLAEGWQSRLLGFPPEPSYNFQGRAKELLELGRAFGQHKAVLVSGMGGMGKTALSREAAAWWLRTGRFDAAIFCSFEEVRSVERVAQVIGQAFEGLEFNQRPPEEQRAKAVELFRSHKVLLVWDNFESTLPHFQDGGGPGEGAETESDSAGALLFDPDERGRLRKLYRELVDGEPTGRLLVTCRPQETGLPKIKKLPLEGLARHDSLHLLTAIADFEGFDLEREGYEREEIEALLTDLNDHPLSIALIGPHLKRLKPKEIRSDFTHHLDRFADDTAEEGRNKSLKASLAFSVSRLSEAAQAVLPYLAWFRGGAFEAYIRRFAGLDEDTWATVRQELEATALVQVEDLGMFNTPFVRFHPTLAFAAEAEGVEDVEAAEQRFLAVYQMVSQEVHKALFGQAAGAGMVLMAREEGNVRAVIRRSFLRDERELGWSVASTLQNFLQMAGRRRERDALAAWVRQQDPDDTGLDHSTCVAIWNHAQGLFARGALEESVSSLEGLAQRLESEGLMGGENPGFQIGTTYSYLGETLVNARQPKAAVSASRRAISFLEELEGEAGQDNLAAALGDLANALMMLGRHDEALDTAERGVAIDETRGRYRNVAAGHGRCGSILQAQGRYAEAEPRYEKAVTLARQVGDLELEAVFLQYQGTLSRKRGDLAASAERYEKAVGLFQRAGDRRGEMQTYNLLAATERDSNHLDAAEAWYGRSRQLAEELEDRHQQAAIAQNVGILHQSRAERNEDPAERETLLRQAVASIEESLTIELELGNELGAATSYFQLGTLYQQLGDLDQAEELILKSVAVIEPLGTPDVWQDYGVLAKIAEARGDTEAAALWAAKRDAKREEVERLAAGGSDSPPALPHQLVQAFQELAQVVFAVRSSKEDAPPDLLEGLAQMSAQPEPIGAAGRFFQAVAQGKSPTVPDGLPEPLPGLFAGLLKGLA